VSAALCLSIVVLKFFKRSGAIGKAQGAYIKRDYIRAKEILDSILAEPVPEYTEGYVHALAGEVEYHLGNYSAALQRLKSAMVEIRKDPDRWEDNEYAERVKDYWNACEARKTSRSSAFRPQAGPTGQLLRSRRLTSTLDRAEGVAKSP
jgi:tetratricopeptide (TPR) repeat protein